MATISFQIPDAVMPRVVDALCGMFGYWELLDGQPNPQTRQQFAREQVRNFIRDTVKTWEAQRASETAAQAARDKAESEVTIT